MTCARTGASLRKQIIENIRLTLAEKIGGDGYNFDINEKNVGVYMLKMEQVKSWPYICVTSRAERKEDERESQMFAYMEVILYLYVKDGTDPVSKLEDLVQDVEKAMYIDHTRGNLAINTWAVSLETDIGLAKPYGVAQFTFEIQYRYVYGNP
jgi:hypothetical protein